MPHQKRWDQGGCRCTVAPLHHCTVVPLHRCAAYLVSDSGAGELCGDGGNHGKTGSFAQGTGMEGSGPPPEKYSEAGRGSKVTMTWKYKVLALNRSIPNWTAHMAHIHLLMFDMRKPW